MKVLTMILACVMTCHVVQALLLTTTTKPSICQTRHPSFLFPPTSASFRNKDNNCVSWALTPRRLRQHQRLSVSSSSSSSSSTNDIDNSSPPSPSKLSLFNSLSRSKEPFVPMNGPYVSMYTCGPTVYDHAHVGNFRAFLTYDVLKRALTYFGYDVDHICNLTDVDDKIIQRCDREGVSLHRLTETYIGLFMEDLRLLNIVPARLYPRATRHIEEMVRMIQDLAANDLAYQSAEGSWYFNVQNKPGYGQQLVNLDVANIQKQKNVNINNMAGGGGAAAAAAQDADEYDADKVGVQDFALWKAYKPDFDREDAVWDTAIGKGRPGWHLECSAMAKKYLGDTIDVHAGGVDLKFPHHENEIAQSEGANDGNCRFCNCWIHNGFVNIGDEKMSKSKGNFLTLRTACPKPDDIRAYRYLVVSSQYRNPLSFTEQAMGAAKGALKRMDKVRDEVSVTLSNAASSSSSQQQQQQQSSGVSDLAVSVGREVEHFEKALADDLSMPRAAACLFGVVKAAETEFKRVKKIQEINSSSSSTTDDTRDAQELDLVGIRAVQEALEKMDRVFGIFYEVPKIASEGAADDGSSSEVDDGSIIPDEVMELVEKRTAAKVDKDWALADSLRERITELGFAVKDVKNGIPEVTRQE